RAQRGEHLGHLLRVGQRGLDLGAGLTDPRGRDQLIGAGDLLDGLDGPDALPEDPKFGGHVSPGHFWAGAGRLTLTASCSTSSASIASACSSMTGLPSDAAKPRLKFSISLTSAA